MYPPGSLNFDRNFLKAATYGNSVKSMLRSQKKRQGGYEGKKEEYVQSKSE